MFPIQEPSLIAPSPGSQNLLDLVVLFFGFGLLQLLRDVLNILVPRPPETVLLFIFARRCLPGPSTRESGKT